MEYVRLGRTGLKVSRICLGMMSYSSKTWRPWTLDEDTGRTFVKRALELGLNFFDTAAQRFGLVRINFLSSHHIIDRIG